MVQQVVDDVLERVPQEAAPSAQRREFLVRTTRAAVRGLPQRQRGARPHRSSRQGSSAASDRARRSAADAWASVEASLRVASRAAWQQVVHFATSHDLSRSLAPDLTGSVFDYLDHVHEQARRGLRTRATRRRTAPARGARNRLFQAVPLGPTTWPWTKTSPTGIDDERPARARRDRAMALAEEVVVLAVEPSRRAARPDRVAGGPGPRPSPSCADGLPRRSPGAPDRADRPLPARPTHRRGWRYHPEQAGSSPAVVPARPRSRPGSAVIAPEPVIDCATQAAQARLHAEPSMRRHLCQEAPTAPPGRGATFAHDPLRDAPRLGRDPRQRPSDRGPPRPSTRRPSATGGSGSTSCSEKPCATRSRATARPRSQVERPVVEGRRSLRLRPLQGPGSRPPKAGPDMPTPGADATDDLSSHEM